MSNMKFIVVAIIFVLIFSSSNYAQKLSVGGGGFYILKNTTLRNGFGYQVNLLVKTQSRIAMLSSIGHYHEPAYDHQSAYSTPYTFEELAASGNHLLDGDFTLDSYELSPIVEVFENKSSDIIFCAGVGLGLYYARNKWNPNTYHRLISSVAEDSLLYHEGAISPHVGINFRAVLNIPATSRSYFNIEAKYVYYKPEIRYEINAPEFTDTYYGKRKINLNTLSINISLMLVL